MYSKPKSLASWTKANTSARRRSMSSPACTCTIEEIETPNFMPRPLRRCLHCLGRRREKRPPGARTPAGARPLSVSPRGGLCVTGASGSMDVGAPRSTPRPHPNPLPAGEGGKTSPPRLYSSPRVGSTRVSRGGEAGGKGSGRPREAPLREGMDSRFHGNDGYGRVSQGSPLEPRRTPALCVLAALSARMTQVAADQFVGVS